MRSGRPYKSTHWERPVSAGSMETITGSFGNGHFGDRRGTLVSPGAQALSSALALNPFYFIYQSTMSL